MKLKTRIVIGFGMSILVPLLLFSATLYGLSHTKLAQQVKDSTEVVYDISVGESANSQTQVRLIAKDVLFTATVILVFTALSIGLWIYRSIATPLVKLKKATQNIKEGKTPRGYWDGVEAGKMKARRFVADLFNKHLNVSMKRPTKNAEKALAKFQDFINLEEEKP